MHNLRIEEKLSVIRQITNEYDLNQFNKIITFMIRKGRKVAKEHKRTLLCLKKARLI